MADKAEDAAGLAPFEDDNTVSYKTDRQDEWFSGGLTIKRRGDFSHPAGYGIIAI